MFESVSKIVVLICACLCSSMAWASMFDESELFPNQYALIIQTEKQRDKISPNNKQYVLDTNEYSNLKDGLFVLVEQFSKDLPKLKRALKKRGAGGGYIKNTGYFTVGKAGAQQPKIEAKLEWQFWHGELLIYKTSSGKSQSINIYSPRFGVQPLSAAKQSLLSPISIHQMSSKYLAIYWTYYYLGSHQVLQAVDISTGRLCSNQYEWANEGYEDERWFLSDRDDDGFYDLEVLKPESEEVKKVINIECQP